MGRRRETTHCSKAALKMNGRSAARQSGARGLERCSQDRRLTRQARQSEPGSDRAHERIHRPGSIDPGRAQPRESYGCSTTLYADHQPTDRLRQQAERGVQRYLRRSSVAVVDGRSAALKAQAPLQLTGSCTSTRTAMPRTAARLNQREKRQLQRRKRSAETQSAPPGTRQGHLEY